jgi:hypothetical protein
MSFPPAYPTLPPLVTFSTDIFHPLLTPLTTYTYTTGSLDTDTVSATDEERLPPGGYSLRHGFSHWFGRARRTPGSRNVSESSAGSHTQSTVSDVARSVSGSSRTVLGDVSSRRVLVADILKYMQSAFSEESVLDAIPLEAAANPGAYHAWRAHRGQDIPTEASATQTSSDTNTNLEPEPVSRKRMPGYWNWEGVWEDRVRKAIKASLSDPVLFSGGADEINFLDLDKETLGRVRKEIQMAAT